MSVYSWTKDPVQAAIEYERRSSTPGQRAEAGALIMWAAWTVDSLYYLEEIVEADRDGPNFFAPHNPATKAVAHLRWAAGSSITAIDLCAAVAARELGLRASGNEFDARKLESKRIDLPANTVSGWPNEIRNWLVGLIGDPDYPIVLGSRHPLTHRRLIRHFTTADRSIRVDIGRARYTTDELILRARKLATRQVESFLGVVAAL